MGRPQLFILIVEISREHIMKITKSKLKQIIQEVLKEVINEGEYDPGDRAQRSGMGKYGRRKAEYEKARNRGKRYPGTEGYNDGQEGRPKNPEWEGDAHYDSGYEAGLDKLDLRKRVAAEREFLMQQKESS